MSEDFRRARRRRAVEAIEVVDTMTGQVVGRIGNLSESGLMLMASRELLDDALFQFRFRLPMPGGGAREVEIGTHQLWSEQANMPGQYWCGFRFIDISADALEALRDWVDAPGSQYA